MSSTSSGRSQSGNITPGRRSVHSRILAGELWRAFVDLPVLVET
jgi:predicted nucleotidyltransferase